MPPTYQPGLYDAEILSQGFGLAGTGKKYFWIECRILGHHPAGSRAGHCPPYVRTPRYYLTKAAAPIFDEALVILGVTRAQLVPDVPAGTNPGWVHLTGRRAVVRCTHETYDGQTFERWRLARQTPPGAAAAAGQAGGPLTPADIAALLNSLPSAAPATAPADSPTDPPVPPSF